MKKIKEIKLLNDYQIEFFELKSKKILMKNSFSKVKTILEKNYNIENLENNFYISLFNYAIELDIEKKEKRKLKEIY